MHLFAARLSATLLLIGTGSLSSPRASAHGDVHETIVALTAEIAASPPNVGELHLRRGQMHRVHGDPDAAAADFNAAEKLAPDLVEVDLARGELLSEATRFDEARAAIDRYLGRRPNSSVGFAARARMLVRAGEHLAAAADFAKAAALAPEPDPTLFIEQARALEMAGLHEKAVQTLEEAIARRGSLVALVQTALEIADAHGSTEKALEHVDQLLAGAARKERWLARKGALLEKMGRAAEARECYLQAQKALAAVPAARRNSAAMAELSQELAAALLRSEHLAP